MPKPLDLAAIAREMKAVQDRGLQIETLTSRLTGFGNAEAYAVAWLVHEMRLREGAQPAGRKIGFTNPEMWSLFGVNEPIWAFVYDTSVVQLTGRCAHCRIDRFVEPRIEPEVVVHFHTAPPKSENPAEILECVDWIAHGVEIVQSHFPGWRFEAADTIADWGLHAMLIVGEPQAVDRLGPQAVSDLEHFTIALACNGKELERGRGSNAMGNPLKAVAHLIGVLEKQSQATPLQAGELVTTGTLTAALPISTGQHWTTTLDGIALPGLSVFLEV
jgi:2-oxo-3-hexenedioate decarboxylase